MVELNQPIWKSYAEVKFWILSLRSGVKIKKNFENHHKEQENLSTSNFNMLALFFVFFSHTNKMVRHGPHLGNSENSGTFPFPGVYLSRFGGSFRSPPHFAGDRVCAPNIDGSSVDVLLRESKSDLRTFWKPQPSWFRGY